MSLSNNGVGILSSDTESFVNKIEPYNEASLHSQGGYLNTTVGLATESGGAIFLINSTMSFHQGVFIFNKNSAYNGGAIFIGRNSSIQFNNSNLEFFNNTATSQGGAMYINIDTNISKIADYYNILANLTKHDDSNIANKSGNYAYFNISDLLQCQPNISEMDYSLFASSVCSVAEDFNNAAVKVDKSNYTNRSVSFWLHDLKLNLVAQDYFGHLLIPFEGLLSCNNTQCKGYNMYRSCDEGYKKEFNYVIQSIDGNVILTLKDTGNISCCCLTHYNYKNVITLTALNVNVSEIPVTVIWTIGLGNCSGDIGHYIVNKMCLPVSCDNLLQAVNFPPGLACPNGYMTAVPSYWYENGFKSYITSCPADNCNLSNWYTKLLLEPFPDQNLQCNGNRRGFACGECNADYAIKYGTTECVPVHECHLHTSKSMTYSLLILFGVSLAYWIVIISFIFVLLHFKYFNVKAGYGYGIIFYYSVLEQIVVVFNEIVHTENCGFSNDEHYNQCVSAQTNHHVLKQHLLPFLSAIGILKPPFMQYMHLCLDKSEMIDHIFLLYIHPVIVMLIVTVLFISYRNCAIVARAVGRFINSATICLLILLSYSSVSHTSLQLLRPLPYFEFSSANGTSEVKGWKSHWSPANPYFSGRHKYYFTVAILCELVIGIGLPVFLLLQRRLTRYFNFNRIKLIIDQLQGCYRNECYWFAAYYLICRQIIYWVDILIVFEVCLWTDHISVKLVAMLIICIFILAIHLWFKPYKTAEELETRNLNLLDSAILLTLVILLVCSLDGRSYGITVVFWILPLIFLFNYLTYSTKLKHIFALSSICVVITLASILVFVPPKTQFYYLNFVSILCLLTSICLLIMYVMVMIKLACTKYWHRKDPPENPAQIIDYSIESDFENDI